MKQTLPILVFALGWLACSGFGLGTGAKVSELERREYAAALSVLSDDPEAAAQSLERFLVKWPRSPLAGDASTRLAEMALARGDQDAALRHYEYVIRHFPNGNRIDSARVGAASIPHGPAGPEPEPGHRRLHRGLRRPAPDRLF